MAHRPRARVLPLLAALALCLAPAAARAQTVEGTLTSLASGQPVPGALVTLLDAAGREARTAVSDAAGRYRLTAPAPGAYRLRVERVRHATTSTPSFGLRAGQALAYPLALRETVTSLEGLRVEARPRCRVRARDGQALERAWDEARKALRITARTAADSALAFSYTTYWRVVERDGRLARDRKGRVVLDSTEARQAVGSLPFASLPADSLERVGFAHRLPDGDVAFYGPDADVLLSDVFLDTHCFRLTAGRGAEAGMLGLAFEPVPGRARPDVRGTLWLDPATSELRHLEFVYTGIRNWTPVRAGGRVEFARLPTGAWIVRSWQLRWPEGTMSVDPRGTLRVRGGSGTAQEQGGTVTGVRGRG